MTKQIFDTSGIGVNGHTELPPIIHVHNTEPFETYQDAVTALRQKILHPGEIVIVYYTDPTAEDGISSLIATGPLYQGGINEIFKSADQIDELVVYMRNQLAAQDEQFNELSDQIKADVDASVRQQIEALIIENRSMINAATAELSEKIDVSTAESEARLRNEFLPMIESLELRENEDVESLSSSIRSVLEGSERADASIMRAIDASYIELVRMIDNSGSSSDASIINYVDGKVGELNNRITITAQELHNELVAADSSLDVRVDTLELKLENEIIDRTEDIDREIVNLRSEQRNYTDNLRLDVSLGLRENAAASMIYTDSSVASLRREMKSADVSLEERVNAYTDSSVASIDRRLSQTIAAQKVAIDNHIDASVSELNSEIGAGDERVFDTLKTLSDEGDASVYRELDLKIDATKEELENKIVDAEISAKTYADQLDSILNASLSAVIAAGDEELARDLSIGLNTTLANANEYTDVSVTSLRSEMIVAVEAVDASLKSYTDSNVDVVKNELITLVNNTSANIEEHIDASIVQITNEVSTLVNILDSSIIKDLSTLVQNIDALRDDVDSEIETCKEDTKAYTDEKVTSLREDVSSALDIQETFLIESYTDFGNAIRRDASAANAELAIELKEYTDISVGSLRNYTESAISALRTETETNINSAVSTLDASVSTNITSTANDLKSEFEAADAQLEANVLGQLGTEVDLLELKIAFESSTLAMEFEDRLRETISDLTDGYLESDASVVASVDAKIVDLSSNIDNEFATVRADYAQKIDDLRFDVSTADDELREYVDSLDASNNEEHERIIDMIHNIDSSTEEELESIEAYIELTKGNLEDLIIAKEVSIGDRLDKDELDMIELGEALSNLENKTADDIATLDSSLKNYTDGCIETLSDNTIAALQIINDWCMTQDSSIERLDSSIASVYDYVDVATAKIDASIVSLGSSVDELGTKTDALGVYIDETIGNLRSYINDVASDVSLAFVEIDENHEFIERNAGRISLVDASVHALYAMVDLIYKRLGLDKVQKPETDILPDIMQKIEDIYDNELEWRVFDSSLPYEPEWRDNGEEGETNETNNMEINNSVIRNIGETTNDGNEEQTVVADPNNRSFNSFWRNLG